MQDRESEQREDVSPHEPETASREHPWFRVLDWFTPTAERDLDVDDRRRVRYLVVSSAIGAATFLSLSLIVPDWGARAVGAANTATGVLLLFVPVLLKLTGRLVLATRIHVAILFCYVAGLTIATGGASVGILYAACVVPVAASLLGGGRSGVLWTLPLLGVLVGVMLAGRAGVEFPLQPNPNVTAINRFYGAIALTLGVLWVVRIYETTKNQALREIEAAYDAARREQRRRARSEQRFRTLFENALVCIHEVGPDGRIQSMNPAGLAVLGFKQEEDIIGTAYLDFVADFDRERVSELMQRALSGEVCEFEFTADLGGSLRTFVSSFIPLRDSRGDVVRLIGHTHDITERTRAERALRNSEERLAMVLEATSEGLWDWNLVTDEVFFSRQWFESLGYAAGDFPNHVSTWEALIHPDDMPQMQELLRKHIEGKTESYECENRLLMKSGEWRENLDRGSVVERDDEGRPLRMVGIDVDITHRKRDEAALAQSQKLESLGVLAGGIAHDFNNLLVGILGNAELARAQLDVESPVRETLGEIEAAGQQAADLTKQLLAYAGKGESQVECLDLDPLVEDALRLARGSVSRELVIRHRHAAGAVTRVNADAGRIRQVVINLVINAAESIGSGPGTVLVRTGVMHATRDYLDGCSVREGLTEGECAFIEIQDDGCGMDAATVAKIFDPFFTSKSFGRGLGLATTLGTVVEYGGTIKVSSEPGRGATFRLLFPNQREEAQSGFERDAVAERNGSGRVLVADDDGIVLSVTEKVLTRAGFQVVAVASGAEALQRVREDPDGYSAALLDLNMPDMSGEATFEKLREIRGDLPVVFFSGHSEQDIADLVDRQPRTAFVSKPFRSSEIVDSLNGLLGTTGA